MKYMIFKDVVTVQGHGAVLLLQVGSTALCLGNSGRSNEGATLEIRLFAPMAEKRFTVNGFNSAEGLLGALMRGEVVLQVASVPTKRAADICPRCEGVGQYVDYIGKRVCSLCDGTGIRR